MAKNSTQVTSPLHIENTVNSLAIADLKLPQAFSTYREMLLDEYISGGLLLTKNLINKLNYQLEVPEGATANEKALIKGLNKSLGNLEGYTKTDLLNNILSMMDYGQSLFEMVLKREDGNMVFKTFSPIHPINVNRYEYTHNTLTKLYLNPADNDGLIQNTEAAQKELDGKKVLHFKLNPSMDYPLGQSLLNRCYMPWKKKGIVSEYELIGIAKNLSGVLKVKAPAEYINDYYNNPTSENGMYMQELIDQAELIHGGKSSLAVIASDATETGVSLFDLTTIGNSDGNDVDVNQTITRFDQAILTTLYTDILTLGQAGGGSFALSDSKTTILSLFIESLLNTINSGFEKGIKAAYSANGITPKGEYPKLRFDDVEKLDFDTFSKGWQRLIQSGGVMVDDQLEAFLRERGKAPKMDKTTTRTTPDVVEDNERDEKEK